MKSLIKTVIVAGSFAIASSAMAAQVGKSGSVDTEAHLGTVNQSATGGGSAASGGGSILGGLASGRGSSSKSASSNTLEVGTIRGSNTKVDGDVKTKATTRSVTQSARDGGQNSIKIGNVE